MAAGREVEPDLDLARSMFDSLRAHTSVGRGITRATYGEGENFAHGLARRTAEGLGLEIKTDAALNLYMTLPGSRRELPRLMTGSHMDSVPQGGNYDGAAGVVGHGHRPADIPVPAAARAQVDLRAAPGRRQHKPLRVRRRPALRGLRERSRRGRRSRGG